MVIYFRLNLVDNLVVLVELLRGYVSLSLRLIHNEYPVRYMSIFELVAC